MKRRLRLLILGAVLVAAAIGITASPAGAAPPAGMVCYPIEGESHWAACEVSQYLPSFTLPQYRNPAWMVCRDHETFGWFPWQRYLNWECGWSQDSGVQLRF